MKTKTIRQVSLDYDISRRMLCYYEKIGLLKSSRKDDYAYRVYDEYELIRLQQVILLRKLQIPMKQVKEILENQNAVEVIEIFKQKINELDEQITALSAVKSILSRFVEELQEKANVHLNLDLLKDKTMLAIVSSLSFPQNKVKENISTLELNKAAEVLSRLKYVRVVYVPPMTVASIYCAEDESYEKSWQAVTDFVKQNNLLEIKPDLRVFKFDYRNSNRDFFGTEIWVSIPDYYDVPLPFSKKKFLGGQYAAHLSEDDDIISVYIGLQDWINESEKYQYDTSLDRCCPPIKEVEGFGGTFHAIDEVLNFYNDQSLPTENRIEKLVAIKDYILSEEIPEEIPGSMEKCGFKTSIITKNKFRIMGFTQISTQDVLIDGFINKVKKDGRLDIIKKYRKPGAPILFYESFDLDTHIISGRHQQMWSGTRLTVCLAESDVSDVAAFMKHNLYTETIDASRWLIFELLGKYRSIIHTACKELGYLYNCIISGILIAMPDDKVLIPDNNTEIKSGLCLWYPVK